MSRENFRRLHDQDPEQARQKDEFFQLCIKAEGDSKLSQELALVRLPNTQFLVHCNLTFTGSGYFEARYDTILLQKGQSRLPGSHL